MERPPIDIRDIDAGLLDRYLAGEATAAEIAYVDKLIATHAPLGASLARLKTDLTCLTDTPAYSTGGLAGRAHALRALADAVPTEGVVPLRASGADTRRDRRRWLRHAGWPIAAAACVAAAIMIIAREGATVREYATNPGQRETITLADGTGLTLGPASRLRVAGGYGGARRELTLDGEAYFVVEHDDRRPFVVRAGHAVLSDVGTRFDVRAYRGDPAVRVVVEDGAVAIGATMLGTRDLATIGPSGAMTVRHGLDVAPYLVWRNGELAFLETPLREIVPELERWYGIRVRVTDPALDSRVLTASFKDETPANALHAIATTLGATAEWHGQTVILSPL